MKKSTHTFKTDPPITLPVIRFKGKKKGPVGFISGGMHGDEINGMMLVKKFVEDFIKGGFEKDMKGELIVLPLLNSTGFAKGQRRSAVDGLDLNRCFPGKKNGTFGEQFAKELFDKFFSKADFGIDCHDAGTSSALLPHTRVGACEDEAGKCLTENLGRLFGTEIIVERKGKAGMMALAAYEKFKKPLVTVEIGGARHIFDDFVKEGVKGIKNILKYYEMIPGKPRLPKKQFILKKRLGVKAPQTGIIEFSVELGDFVHAGDKIGRIYFPQTFEEEDLRSPMCGLIFSLHDHQIVKESSVMYSVLETKKCHVDRTTLDKFEELGKLEIEEVVM
jgi:uncharacterized protein